MPFRSFLRRRRPEAMGIVMETRPWRALVSICWLALMACLSGGADAFIASQVVVRLAALFWVS
ncbi:hypothetical protein [Frankia sp. R82]|uniref:hypothetical protein n=1 Tax=Frankia sp. R82 TaxID=2950553 RepID=UPI0020449F9F|nr:hypothetical protein [Frankia sp. R82]MCM3883363.1 hypothetical protein [Frankia sp. R82]